MIEEPTITQKMVDFMREHYNFKSSMYIVCDKHSDKSDSFQLGMLYGINDVLSYLQGLHNAQADK